jgi:hypothetical protein
MRPDKCDWCKEKKDERLTYDRIKNKRGHYCEGCLDGYSVYVDEQIAWRKDEQIAWARDGEGEGNE